MGGFGYGISCTASTGGRGNGGVLLFNEPTYNLTVNGTINLSTGENGFCNNGDWSTVAFNASYVTIDTGGDVRFNGILNATEIVVSGKLGPQGSDGIGTATSDNATAGGNLTISAITVNITSSGTITVRGGNLTASVAAFAGAGGTLNISVTNFYFNGNITLDGGEGRATSNHGNGGNAGTLILDVGSNTILNGNIFGMGGFGYSSSCTSSTGSRGSGGSIIINEPNYNLTVLRFINFSRGEAGLCNNGNGGMISINASVLNITGKINVNGNISGNITLYARELYINETINASLDSGVAGINGTNGTIRLIFRDALNISASVGSNNYVGPNVILVRNTTNGRIEFLTAFENRLNVSVDYDSVINISSNNISMDTGTYGYLNKSAELWFYSIAGTPDAIQSRRNLQNCSSAICTWINNSGPTYIFNVTSFSDYSVLIDSIVPGINYSVGTAAEGATLAQSNVFINVSVNETNIKNITFYLYDSSLSQISNKTYYDGNDALRVPVGVNLLNNSYGSFEASAFTSDNGGTVKTINNLNFNGNGWTTTTSTNQNATFNLTAGFRFDVMEIFFTSQNTRMPNNTNILVSDNATTWEQVGSQIQINNGSNNSIVGRSHWTLGLDMQTKRYIRFEFKDNMGNTIMTIPELLLYMNGTNLANLSTTKVNVSAGTQSEAEQTRDNKFTAAGTYDSGGINKINVTLNFSTQKRFDSFELAHGTNSFHPGNYSVLVSDDPFTDTWTEVKNGSFIATSGLIERVNFSLQTKQYLRIQIKDTPNNRIEIAEIRVWEVPAINYSHNFTSLSDGSYSYNVSVYDDFHNGNATATRNITLDTTTSSIDFDASTPANRTYTSNASVPINASIVEQNLDELKYNWNRTNYTLFNDSLVLLMNFDNRSVLGEGISSNITVDVSGYGNNGTCRSMSVVGCNYTSGKYGNAMSFDGTNDYINTSFSAVKNSTSVWYKNSTASGWTHVAYNGTAYFVNAIATNPSQYPLNVSGNDLQIGINGSLYFNGTIDEVMVFNRSLSASEVYQLYASNLYRFNATQWYLYVNQSKNSSTRLDEGNYTYFVSAKDNSGTLNMSELRTVSIDTTIPALAITTPINNTNTTNNVLNVNFTVSDSNLGSCWYSNDTYTINRSTGCTQNLTNITWSEGGHNVTVYANDSAGNVNFSSITFSVDSSAPSVTISYPKNTTTHYSSTIDFNASVSDAQNVTNCLYSLDLAANVSMTKTNTSWFSATSSSIAHGKHNLTISCNDTLNNWGSAMENNFDVVLTDLKIISVGLPTQLYTNNTFARVNVSNPSTPNATNVNVSVIVNGTLLNSSVFSNVPGTGSAVVNITFKPSAGTNMSINVTIDLANAIPESNETNNWNLTYVNITQLANITIVTLSEANTTQVITINGTIIGNDNAVIANKLFTIKLNNVTVSSDTLLSNNFSLGNISYGGGRNGTNVNGTYRDLRLNLTSEGTVRQYTDSYSTTGFSTDAYNYSSIGFNAPTGVIFELDAMTLALSNVTYRITSVSKLFNVSVFVTTQSSQTDPGGNTSIWYKVNYSDASTSWTLVNSSNITGSRFGGWINVQGQSEVYIKLETNTSSSTKENPITALEINYTDYTYPDFGEFNSSTIRLPNVTYTILRLDENLSGGAGDVKLQLREGDDGSSWDAWGSNFSSGSNNDISSFSKDYLQFRMFLETTNTSRTPVVFSVNISYFNASTNASGGYNYNITIPSDYLGVQPLEISVSSGQNIDGRNTTNITVCAETNIEYR